MIFPRIDRSAYDDLEPCRLLGATPCRRGQGGVDEWNQYQTDGTLFSLVDFCAK